MAAYEKGLIEVAEGAYAYLQPYGGWGLSNAGLVVDGEESLLVDTLFDERHTREMLAAMRRVSDAAEVIDTLVNTPR
jgi:cyclase